MRLFKKVMAEIWHGGFSRVTAVVQHVMLV